MMENIIKHAVQTEVSKYIETHDQSTAAGSTSTSSRKRKTETRLSALIGKIKKKKQSNEVRKDENKDMKVHFKWKRYDLLKNKEVIVSQKYGGGFRYAHLKANDKLEIVRSKALDLFFPNRVNFFGESVTECQIFLKDSSDVIVDLQMPIKDFIKNKGVYLSRTYLVLHTKNTIYSIGDLVPVVIDQGVNFQTISPNLQITNAGENEPQNVGIISNANSAYVVDASSNNNVVIVDENVQIANNSSANSDGSANAVIASRNNNVVIANENVQIASNSGADSDGSAYADTVPIGDTEYQNLLDASSSSDVAIVNENVQIADNRTGNDTNRANPENGEQVQVQAQFIEKETIEITIHRISMKTDMIHQFKTLDISRNIEFRVIDPRGRQEPGRGSGVDRDVYTSVWREILDSLCVGDRERVPFIRHDLFIDDWKAIGKILVKGYIDTGFYPLELSKAFILNCLYNGVHNDTLIDSFFLFLSPSEEELVREALKTTNADVYDDEDFLDLLDRFNCRSRVHPLNVYGVIKEIARQELIQRPYLMVCSWTKALAPLRNYDAFSSASSINAMYKKVIATNQAVNRLFSATVSSDAERETFKYLKQYVRELDKASLKKFLHFCTGTDIILVKEIVISFVAFPSNFSRRPVAHTCRPLLELASSYRSFCELREEFEGILKPCSWEMDTY